MNVLQSSSQNPDVTTLSSPALVMFDAQEQSNSFLFWKFDNNDCSGIVCEHMLYSSQFCFRDMGSEPLCGTFLFMRHRAELTSRAQVSRQGTSYKLKFNGISRYANMFSGVFRPAKFQWATVGPVNIGSILWLLQLSLQLNLLLNKNAMYCRPNRPLRQTTPSVKCQLWQLII